MNFCFGMIFGALSYFESNITLGDILMYPNCAYQTTNVLIAATRYLRFFLVYHEKT
jgi:hypothetical protein